MTIRTHAEFAAKHYADTVTKVAEGLRKLADDAEREGRHTTNHRGEPDYATAAYSVLHAITWGIANLHTEGLVTRAADADRAAQEEQP